MAISFEQDLKNIRSQGPLIHNITNYVVMAQTANALLALGASPVMAHAIAEVEAVTKISQALVINIGTLSPHWIEAMHLAQAKANACGVKIVLDPVGAGASALRTDTAKKILSQKIDVLRGNASEIMALAGGNIASKGVDSTAMSDTALTAAVTLSKTYDCVVVISGVTDYIVQGDDYQTNDGGCDLMTKVTGMGCTASALIGAFLAVNNDCAQAAAHAMHAMSLAAADAFGISRGSGTFAMNFQDALYLIK